jgi:PTS system mannose-specific IIB component/fructoselysine and glucoselysine-specific PTS system IIB component
MTVALARIDDRLVHGQVVVGWGRPLRAAFVAVVDDALAASEWEQELYRMGAPDELALEFVTVTEAAARIAQWEADPRPGMVLFADVAAVAGLRRAGAQLPRLNLGGIHHRPGRRERLPYVFLTDDEFHALEGIAATGTEVTAQDVPATRPVALTELR